MNERLSSTSDGQMEWLLAAMEFAIGRESGLFARHARIPVKEAYDELRQEWTLCVLQQIHDGRKKNLKERSKRAVCCPSLVKGSNETPNTMERRSEMVCREKLLRALQQTHSALIACSACLDEEGEIETYLQELIVALAKQADRLHETLLQSHRLGRRTYPGDPPLGQSKIEVSSGSTGDE